MYVYVYVCVGVWGVITRISPPLFLSSSIETKARRLGRNHSYFSFSFSFVSPSLGTKARRLGRNHSHFSFSFSFFPPSLGTKARRLGRITRMARRRSSRLLSTSTTPLMPTGTEPY
jgi:hypothetical protein